MHANPSGRPRRAIDTLNLAIKSGERVHVAYASYFTQLQTYALDSTLIRL